MIFSTSANSYCPYPPRDKRTFGNDDRNNSVSTHTFRVLFGGARQGCRRFGLAGEIKNRQQNRLAVGTKSCDPAVPPNIETASLPLPLIGCQHSQASNASFTSSATRHLSPQPSGAHIIGFGPCRHHTAADSLLVRHPFSSRQRFVKLFLCYHRIFPLSTDFDPLFQIFRPIKPQRAPIAHPCAHMLVRTHARAHDELLLCRAVRQIFPRALHSNAERSRTSSFSAHVSMRCPQAPRI